MKPTIVFALLSSLAACAASPETNEAGPPYVEDAQSLGSAKADGGLALGIPAVLGQQAGYRSAEPVNFSCTPGGWVAFDVKYENTSLPWGVELSLWRGMAGEDWCGGCEPPYHNSFDWSYHQVDAMKSIGPWQWAVHTESYGYAAGAGGRFTAMKFVVRIKMPDGSIRWDNGGSNLGYYQVQVPDPKCEATWTPWQSYDSKAVDLPILKVWK